jgi:tetratricopeptide (TPR) repeat protein
MTASSREEALYLFMKGEDFEGYDDLDDAVNSEVENDYGNYFSCDGEEYLVFEDEDEARDYAIEGCINLFDDVGVFGLSDYTTDWAINNAMDASWFDDAMQESNEAYAEDIKDESSSDEDLYVNRLHEELVDFGLMDELDLPDEPDEDDHEENGDYDEAYEAWEEEVQELKDSAESEAENKISELAEKMGENYDDAIEWYKDNFGSEELGEIAKRHNLIDEDAVAEMIVDTDGIAHCISSYDGEEHEQDSYLLYRHN